MISFSKRGDQVNSALKVHGRHLDRPEYDDYRSDYTRNAIEAIRMSRL